MYLEERFVPSARPAERLADAVQRLVQDRRALPQLRLGGVGAPDELTGLGEHALQALVELVGLRALARPAAGPGARLLRPGRPGLPPAAVLGALLAAHLPGGMLQLLLEVADGAAHLVADLAGQVADGAADVGLQLGQLVLPAAQLLAARLGDPVDLAAALLAAGDQALGLQPLQPRVDGARGGRVQAHEAVLEQADDLVAVPGLLVEQLEHVQAEPAVAEDRAHAGSPSGSPESSSGSSEPRRSSATFPEVALATSCAVPAPSRPLTSWRPGMPECHRPSKAAVTWPLVDCRRTSRSLRSGTRMSTSPETVASRMLPPPARDRSQVTEPEMVSASTAPPRPSARVTSPEMVRMRRSSPMPCASTEPDTVSAWTGPASPARVMSPLTTRTSTRARSPDTITLEDTSFRSTGQSRGTARDTTARRFHLRRPNSQPRRFGCDQSS